MDYTTNFTQMRYKRKTAFEYWNAFDRVRVAASLDANHERGEYLRKNMDWSVVVQNRRDMIEQCPHVYFEITPTVSIFNVLNLPDFHKEWIEEELLEPANIRINILLDPTYMRLSMLPPEKKDEIRLRYLEHIKYLNQFDNIKHVVGDYESIIKFLNTDKVDETKIFLYKTKQMDNIRQENFQEVFPELKDLQL
jgi:hypothetical protein